MQHSGYFQWLKQWSCSGQLVVYLWCTSDLLVLYKWHTCGLFVVFQWSTCVYQWSIQHRKVLIYLQIFVAFLVLTRLKICPNMHKTKRIFYFLDAIASPRAPTPVSQWSASQSFIVSDLEIAIASPSFESLFERQTDGQT